MPRAYIHRSDDLSRFQWGYLTDDEPNFRIGITRIYEVSKVGENSITLLDFVQRLNCGEISFKDLPVRL